MRYRENLRQVKIVGVIPKVFIYLCAPHKFIFTEQELFVLTFKTWHRFRGNRNWSSQLYLLIDYVKAPRLLSNRNNVNSEKEFYEMIKIIFDRVNERSEELSEYFDEIFHCAEHLNAVIEEIDFNRRGEFRIHLKEKSCSF